MQAIQISNEAYEILKQHKKVAGSVKTDSEELDELFADGALQVWWFPEDNQKVKDALSILHARVN